MTVQEMLQKVWVTLGEPSDLDPFTYDVLEAVTGISAAGDLMLAELNAAGAAVATWMFPNGQRLRFPELRDWYYVQPVSSTGTLAAGQVAPYDVLTGDFTGLAGYVLQIGTEYHLILAATGASASLAEGFSTDPSGLDWTAWKRVFSASDALVAPAGQVLAIYGVYDFANNRRLALMPANTQDFSNLSGGGNPNVVRLRGRSVIFDVAPETGRYGVEVYRAPTTLADLTDESELPESYHEALVLWAEQWGFTRMQENESAYARKRDLEDFLRRRRTTDDLGSEGRDIKMTPKLEG